MKRYLKNIITAITAVSALLLASGCGSSEALYIGKDISVSLNSENTAASADIEVFKSYPLSIGGSPLTADFAEINGGNLYVTEGRDGEAVITASNVGEASLSLNIGTAEEPVIKDIDLNILPAKMNAEFLDAESGKAVRDYKISADGMEKSLVLSVTANDSEISEYTVSLIAENGVSARIEDGLLYVSAVAEGEHEITVQLTAENFEDTSAVLKFTAEKPELKGEFITPDFKDISLYDDVIVEFIPENVTAERAEAAGGDKNKLFSIVVETSEDIDYEFIDDLSVRFVPKKEGEGFIKITISVKGYGETELDRGFNVAPERARLVIDTAPIHTTTKKKVFVDYTVGKGVKLEITSDEDVIEGKRMDDTIVFFPKSEGEGEITIRAYGKNLRDNIKTIPYKVELPKIEVKEDIISVPEVITKKTFIPFGVTPSRSSVTAVSSDESLFKVEANKTRISVEPLKDGSGEITVNIKASGYEPLVYKIPITIERQKLSLITDVNELKTNGGVKNTIEFDWAPNVEVEILAESSNEKVCTVKPFSRGVHIMGVKPGKAEVKITLKKNDYVSAEHIIKVDVGERLTDLDISGSFEAYPHLRNVISYEVTDGGGKVALDYEGDINIVSFDGGARGKLIFTASGDGVITLTASSKEAPDNVSVHNVVYKEHSSDANGMDMLYLFDEDKNHSVYKHNLIMQDILNVPPTDAERTPNSYGEELDEITQTVNQITAGLSSNYDKVRAIYNWITRNIYYDIDFLENGGEGSNKAYDVFKTRKGICDGYSSLFADMCRIAGVPARKIHGQYKYEDADWESSTVNSHAWNEVWLDGKWKTFDSTWGTFKKYENGQFNGAGGIDASMRYFNPTMRTFSYDHRIDFIEEDYY